VDPARAKIKMALAQLRGVGNDRANPEGASDKTVEHRRCASVVVDLLNPTSPRIVGNYINWIGFSFMGVGLLFVVNRLIID
jgi:hypothetical protein